MLRTPRVERGITPIGGWPIRAGSGTFVLTDSTHRSRRGRRDRTPNSAPAAHGTRRGRPDKNCGSRGHRGESEKGGPDGPPFSFGFRLPGEPTPQAPSFAFGDVT